jgi:hypothetical protein
MPKSPAKQPKDSENDDLYDKALQAATDLFGDRSVSRGETRERLKELASEIDTMIESLGAE